MVVIARHKPAAQRGTQPGQRFDGMGDFINPTIHQVTRYGNQIGFESVDLILQPLREPFIQNGSKVNVRNLHNPKTIEARGSAPKLNLDGVSVVNDAQEFAELPETVSIKT